MGKKKERIKALEEELSQCQSLLKVQADFLTNADKTIQELNELTGKLDKENEVLCLQNRQLITDLATFRHLSKEKSDELVRERAKRIYTPKQEIQRKDWDKYIGRDVIIQRVVTIRDTDYYPLANNARITIVNSLGLKEDIRTFQDRSIKLYEL